MRFGDRAVGAVRVVATGGVVANGRGGRDRRDGRGGRDGNVLALASRGIMGA